MNQLEAIQKQVRIGVLDALDANGPMQLTALESGVESAADVDDIRIAVGQLTDAGLVCKRGHAIALVNEPKKFKKPERRNAHRSEQCLAAMKVAGRPMTTAEIAEAGVGEENIVRATLNSLRKRGAVVSEQQDKLNYWSLPSEAEDLGGSVDHEAETTDDAGAASAAVVAEPAPQADTQPTDEQPRGTRQTGLLDRCVGAIEAAQIPQTTADICRALGETDAHRISHNLNKAAREGRHVEVVERIGRTPLYGLIAWRDKPADESTAAAIATASSFEHVAGVTHRFGLSSDGTLAIETDAGDVDLPPKVTGDLIAYLIRQRRLVQHLFDADASEVGGHV